MKARIHVLLKTRSPLHIAHPNNARMSDAGALTYGENGFPCTAIQKQRFASAHGMTDLPVIAGNNIAGRLRRHAAKLVLDVLAGKGEKVDLQTYSVLMCGASTGKPDTEDMTYSEYIRSREHVYFGLFGGGPKMFERKVRVHGALPITKGTTEMRGKLAHPRADEHSLPESARHLTAVWGFRRVDDLRDLSNMELAEKTIEGFLEKFEARQQAIIADKTAEDGKSSKTSTKTYSAIEFVVPGVPFDLTFELDVATKAQMGLFLAALDSFAADERLGGYVRNGFGVFTFEDVVVVVDDDGEQTIEKAFENGRLVRESDQIIGYLMAWADAAAALDAASIDALVALSDEAVKKHAEKAAKASSKKPKAA